MGDNAFNHLTTPVRELFDRAMFEAERSFFHPSVGIEHVLLAFVTKPNDSPAARILARDFRMDADTVRQTVRHSAMPAYNKSSPPPILPYKQTLRDALNLALRLSREESGGRGLIRTDHLLEAIIRTNDPEASRIFSKFRVAPEGVLAAIELLRERRQTES